MTLSYVIIVPVFLIGIMTVVQASIWYLARDAVLAAARHGADVARTSPSPPGNGAEAAISFATSATPGFLSDIAATTKGTTAATVRIRVSARIPSLVPGLVVRVREVVTAPVEQFVALGDLTVPVRAGLAPVGQAGAKASPAAAGPAAAGPAAAGPASAGGDSAGSRPWLVRS